MHPAMFSIRESGHPRQSTLDSRLNRTGVDIDEKARELGDSRFDSAVGRYRNSVELTRLLSERLASKPLAEWRRLLPEHELIWSPVETLADAVRDPQAHSAGIFQRVRHPTAGDFDSVAPPLRLSGYELRSDRAAPELGVDAEAILEEAGLAPAEIAAALAPE